MRCKPEKAKPMSEETSNLGRQFVAALLAEGHEFHSIQANFLFLLGIGAVGAASKKLATNPRAIRETSGYMRGSVKEAAKMLGVSRNWIGTLLYGANVMTPTPRRNLASVAEPQ